MASPLPQEDQWRRLDVYRQRYRIDDRLEPLTALEQSMRRRRVRSAALSRRLADLEKMVAEARQELRAIASEIEGTHRAGALLIEEVLDQVQAEMGEAWSPRPVHGYRVWRIEDNLILGNQVHWETPTLESKCLREIPGEDLPHPVDRCGPPACGIYAVKDLGMFPSEVARGAIHNSVVGVVAMSGKVVEHESGYRSHRATAVAVSVNDGRRRLMTDEMETIASLFADPDEVMAEAPPIRQVEESPTREFLASIRERQEQWI
jgi:hypothetical protein